MERRKRYHGRAEYQRLIERWRVEGSRVGDFCRRHRVRPSAFAYWRRRLLAEGQQAGPKGSGFVRVMADTATRPGARGNGTHEAQGAIEVLLPRGIAVRIPSGAEALTVRAVLGALAE